MALTNNAINLLNIIILGISFLFVFSAFQTCEMIQEVILESTDQKIFLGAGYKSLAIIYGTFAFSNWIAASIVVYLGPKLSLILGAITYSVFIGSFLKPALWSLYSSSFIIGVGASVLWTAQGNFITIASNSDNISRNMGIFWALFQSSFVVGNAIMYFKFQDLTNLPNQSLALFTILLVLSIIGVITMIAFLKNITEEDDDSQVVLVNQQEEQQMPTNSFKPTYDTFSNNPIDNNMSVNNYDEITEPLLHSERYNRSRDYNDSENLTLQTLCASYRLLKDYNVLLLIFSFMFTGLQITFISSVLTTSVGYCDKFGSKSKAYMGICGMVLGVGEILGGLNFGVLSSLLKSKRTSSPEESFSNGEEFINCHSTKPGLTPCSKIITIGFALNIVAYYLLYLALPQSSPIRLSLEPTFIINELTSLIVVLAASLMLGLADCAYNTQIYIIIATHYRGKLENTALFALFKFVQASMAAIAFYYSKYLYLHWQLLVLIVSVSLGTLTFYRVDQNLVKEGCRDTHRVA